MEMYFGKESAFRDDTSNQIFPLLCKTFASGVVKGETLIAMSIVPFFQWALPACEHFTDIILSCPTDKCISEVEKWRTNAPGALDLSHAAKMICETEGKGKEWPEKQNKLRRKIKLIVKYDVSKCNPLSPTILPQADCLLLTHCLAVHATNKDEFCSAFKNVSSLLKNGGHLVLLICAQQTFYMVGTFKFPQLSIDESLVRKALGDADYVIEEMHVLPRMLNDLFDVADCESFIFVRARKQTPV
ncbi:nicotinamide N-methyltransferase-like isoform X2 [Lissotriton helveticus]